MKKANWARDTIKVGTLQSQKGRLKGEFASVAIGQEPLTTGGFAEVEDY